MIKYDNERLVMRDEFPCHIVIIIRAQNYTSRSIKYNLCNQFTPGKPYIMQTQYIKGALQSTINFVWFKSRPTNGELHVKHLW